MFQKQTAGHTYCFLEIERERAEQQRGRNNYTARVNRAVRPLYAKF